MHRDHFPEISQKKSETDTNHISHRSQTRTPFHLGKIPNTPTLDKRSRHTMKRTLTLAMMTILALAGTTGCTSTNPTDRLSQATAQTQQPGTPLETRALDVCARLVRSQPNPAPFVQQHISLCQGVATLARNPLPEDIQDVANAYLDSLTAYTERLEGISPDNPPNNAMAFFLSRPFRLLEKQRDWQDALAALN